MKMKEKFFLRWHCYQILRGRKQLNRLAEKGHSLSSEKMVALGNKITSHCMKAGLFTLSQKSVM